MEYLRHFLEEYQYAPQAVCALCESAQKLEQSAAWRRFVTITRQAYEAEILHFGAALEKIKGLCSSLCVPWETAHLLWCIALTPQLLHRYEQAGIAQEIFHQTVADFRNKAVECHTVRGIWGVFVAYWFEGYFAMKRFALGRLQFERKPMPYACTVDGVFLEKDAPALNCHIPSSGPLRIADCEQAFAEAKVFFEMPEKTAFLCDSWLLCAVNRKVLPEQSGIRQFAELFTILQEKQTEPFADAWRVFGCDAVAPYENLPQRTSLQRAYAAWLKAGGSIDVALGVLVR